MLYTFENLDRRLDLLGFPKIKGNSGFQTIRTDFRKAYDAGKIEFRDDGIYLIDKGRELKGYMYMPTYRVKHYGSFSKFHITNCSVIEDFIQKRNFKLFYTWSNHKTNDITDRDTGHIHHDQNLKLCSQCSKLLLEREMRDTEDFFNTLDNKDIEEQDIEIDIFGYVKGKEKISKAYRKKMEYRCEECGIQCRNPMHRRWWHVHHIDGDKTNNSESNLECLCVECHAKKDGVHQENFGNNKWNSEVSSFKNEYRHKKN
jgi:hypothetical protein